MPPFRTSPPGAPAKPALDPEHTLRGSESRWSSPFPADSTLDVKSHEITRTQTTDGRVTVKTGMVPVPIVVVEPGRQRTSASRRAGIGSAVGPLAEQRLNEPLGLAVGARRVGPDPVMVQLVGATERLHRRGAIGEGVVGHDPADPNAVAAEPGQRAPEERRDLSRALGREDLDVGQTRGIIDGDMDVLPADAPDAVAPVAGN